MGHGTLKITIEGPTGSGKSVLATLLGNELREIGAKVVFTNPSDIVLPSDEFFDRIGFHGDYYDRVVIETRLPEPSDDFRMIDLPNLPLG